MSGDTDSLTLNAIHALQFKNVLSRTYFKRFYANEPVRRGNNFRDQRDEWVIALYEKSWVNLVHWIAKFWYAELIKHHFRIFLVLPFGGLCSFAEFFKARWRYGVYFEKGKVGRVTDSERLGKLRRWTDFWKMFGEDLPAPMTFERNFINCQRVAATLSTEIIDNHFIGAVAAHARKHVDNHKQFN